MEGLYLLWKFKQNYRVQNRQNAEAVFQAIQYIDANLHTPLHVSDIADNIGLSRSHFSTVFKKVTGENVIHYIFNKRLERARQLLAANDWKVNEIAEKIGIPDHKYFSKWFKKRTGQTPSEYRNQTKG
ncbi:transcriptional regulatory protein [Mycobacterium tuberculosis]|nr:transcriptional regulatory protein [Mycobacterium tuberculosis]